MGYGYSAFWAAMRGPSAAVIETVGWDPESAHNGILEVWLGLGLVGVILWGLSFIGTMGSAMKKLRNREGPYDPWPIVLLTFLFLANVTESVIVRFNNIYWVLFVSVTVFGRADGSLAISGRSSALQCDGTSLHSAQTGYSVPEKLEVPNETGSPHL